MANGKYERIDRTLIHRGAVIDEYVDSISLPDGRIEKWDLVDHKGAAAVVPVRDDGRILMVRQWRNPSGKELLEIPAGKLDARDEPMEEAAARELKEETGYSAGKLSLLVDFCPTVAYSSERIGIYVAEDLVRGRQQLDDDEFLDVEARDADELVQQILRGEITDGKTIAGLFAYVYRRDHGSL